jgi:predicted nuclease of predicted toxin-antitoxin system
VRWLADECVGAPLVANLRSIGHDVLNIAEVAAGESDADVLTRAVRERTVLLTEDKDFGDLILMRIASEDIALKSERLVAAIEHYGDALFDRYLVIEEGRFRSRHLRWQG